MTLCNPLLRYWTVDRQPQLPGGTELRKEKTNTLQRMGLLSLVGMLGRLGILLYVWSDGLYCSVTICILSYGLSLPGHNTIISHRASMFS